LKDLFSAFRNLFMQLRGHIAQEGRNLISLPCLDTVEFGKIASLRNIVICDKWQIAGLPGIKSAIGLLDSAGGGNQ
jgi:hypothetical protein